MTCLCVVVQTIATPRSAHWGHPHQCRTTLDGMGGSTGEGGVARQFDPEKLVVAVNQCFDGFHFTIQTFRPEVSYADRVKAWFGARAAAENRGTPFDDPQPVLSYSGPATFESCAGEERESGFVLTKAFDEGGIGEVIHDLHRRGIHVSRK